jgi:hypothetical protein
MSSRALILATVTFLIGCLATVQAQAENLDAGKSPSQLFAGTCSECHKSSRGLLRKVPAGSLPGFLRQHYTTSGQMAAVLSAYLIANGAADRRPAGNEPKPGTDGKPEQAVRPDADGASPQAERRGRNRLARPAETPDAAKPADGQAPAQATTERGPDGRPAGRSRRGRPGNEELPKTDAAKTDPSKTDASKTDASKTDTSDRPKTDAGKDESAKGETGKSEDNKPEGTNALGEGRPDAAKTDFPKTEPPKTEPSKATGGGESPAMRADPVPSVTPAPTAAPVPPKAASDSTSAPPAPAASAMPPSVTASAPPPAPTAGPPAPPISQ